MGDGAAAIWALACRAAAILEEAEARLSGTSAGSDWCSAAPLYYLHLEAAHGRHVFAAVSLFKPGMRKKCTSSPAGEEKNDAV